MLLNKFRVRLILSGSKAEQCLATQQRGSKAEQKVFRSRSRMEQ